MFDHDATTTRTTHGANATAFDFVNGIRFDYQGRTFKLLTRAGADPVIQDVATYEKHQTTWPVLTDARDRGELTFHEDQSDDTDARAGEGR